jgi:hypothetical protein
MEAAPRDGLSEDRSGIDGNPVHRELALVNLKGGTPPEVHVGGQGSLGASVENGTHRGTASGLTSLRTTSVFPNPRTGNHSRIKKVVLACVAGLDTCGLPSP